MNDSKTAFVLELCKKKEEYKIVIIIKKNEKLDQTLDYVLLLFIDVGYSQNNNLHF